MSGGDPARRALDAKLLAWMREEQTATGAGGGADDARFEPLALELFAFQFARCTAYRRFCEGRGATPDTVACWRDVPAVPTGAFKELVLTCFPPERTRKVFRTSGTSTAARGALHLDTLALYEASLLPTFRRHLLPDLAPAARARIVVLAPSAAEAPDSSLSHMFAVALRELGDAHSFFAVRGGELDLARLLPALERIADAPPDAPLLLCGTAFAFVHLLDALARRGAALALPATARAMETGGFKGRARERSRDDLYGEIEARLGIPARRVVNQYGMTELGSQFYDTVLTAPGAPRHKAGPPWARVLLMDPAGGGPVAPGAVGAIRVHDLANTGSVASLLTADLGRALGPGFEVLGREPGAEARGCSIAADELLGAGA